MAVGGEGVAEKQNKTQPSEIQRNGRIQLLVIGNEARPGEQSQCKPKAIKPNYAPVLVGMQIVCCVLPHGGNGSCQVRIVWERASLGKTTFFVATVVFFR